ncbi:LamG domain-containing protein [Myceligenerans crystallogenes]|uniref:LamG-like jellyroll fold domain-containing protein n=1 Tax=Myceligenerans crystallogenes TaxID=316335 RepID=A0ABN2NAE7_9MICO
MEPPFEGPEVEQGPVGDGLADDGRPVEVATGDGSVPPEEFEVASEAEQTALAEATESGEPVEVVEQRHELGEVWALPSGKLEGREFVVPRWTRKESGWVRVDTTLEPTVDGMVAPVASTVATEFSGGGDGPLVRLERAGRVLELSWPGTLPAPVLEGDTARYVEVLEGVDLRMTATEAGYTSYVIVKTPEAAASPELAAIRFGLQTEGLEVGTTTAGGFEATDASGAAGAVFEAPPASMWDTVAGEPASTVDAGASVEDAAATADPKAGSAEGATDSGDSAVMAMPSDTPGGDAGNDDSGGAPGVPDDLARVETRLSADGGALTLVPDQELLTDPDTTFPIVIDPQLHTPKPGAWASPNKSYPDNMGWMFNGESTQGLGNCAGWYDCGSGSTYRLFYQFDVSRFKGTRIISAEFGVKNVHSAVCSNHRVDLWRTAAINSSNTSWNLTTNTGFWKEPIANNSFHYGGSQSTCQSPDYARFGIKDTVQHFADEGWSRLTLGLKAFDEPDPSYWKKFSKDAYVRVEYNLPPNRVKSTQLSMDPGGSCAKQEDASRIRTIGNLVVSQASDPDPGDRIQVRFTITDLNNNTVWTSGLVPTGDKASPSPFTQGVPAEQIPENKMLRWAVRVFDGDDTGMWSYEESGWHCHFVYDTLVKGAPTITSAQWPKSDPADPDDPWHDGVGQSGEFSFSHPASDVVKYRYEIGTPVKDSSPEVSASRHGFWMMPSEPGVYTINAVAFDGAGNKSSTGTYQVRIGAGRPPVSSWGFDGETGDSPLTLSGNAHVAQPATAVSGKALMLDGAGDSGMAGPSERVATLYSFAVEAWVWLDEFSADQAVVVSQTGPDYMDYKLYYTGSADGRSEKWAFGRYTSEKTIVAASSDVLVRKNRWTHLVGVHNSVTNQLRIYVDGVPSTPREFTDPTPGDGPVTIGAGRYASTAGATSHVPGRIDGVRLYNRFVPTEEAKLLAGRRPYVASRWTFETQNADGSFPNDYVNSSEVRGPALLGINGPVTDIGGPKVGDSAMALNGTQHAYTPFGQIPVDTTESFTIAAWAQSAADLNSRATVMSLTGSNESALQVRAAPQVDVETEATVVDWELVVRSSDGSSATVSQLTGDWAGPYTTDWTHVAVTFDPVARTARLWINGASPTTAGQIEETELFAAEGRAAFGARLTGGEWSVKWPGLIDDAWIYRGALSSAQVERLALGDNLATEVPAP